ncbi:MAG: gamma-glutamyltransferase [Gammaproteobacteria bacterium]|nr:gamma-glutamyltransferase [Gammaproteobacteria bacterium]
MVSSQEQIATRVGVEILKQGGNAVDAAVAVGFTLAVTLPRAGNLGGGGFMLVHLADSKQTLALDYREMAPAAAYRDMYLNADGSVDKQRSRFHGLAVGVPGSVKGLTTALQRYGTMTLQQVMLPAIRLAEKGFAVSRDLALSLARSDQRLKRWPAAQKVFYHADGSNYQTGEILLQADLARTLKRIAQYGDSGFYRGSVAQRIVDTVNQAGGSMTLADLSTYQVRIRQPVVGDYRGHRIASMPPPSSGGTHIIQILNQLEHYDLQAAGHNSALSIHLMAEAMKQAYADRSEYLGDPDYVEVPVAELTAKAYAAKIKRHIHPARARASDSIKPGLELPAESPQTTHFSVVDRWGNAVSNTYTLNFSYGSGLMAEDTGVLLNNEMDDFSAKPGVANAYGLIGGEANAVAGGKRPLSSMSPTLVFTPDTDEVLLVTGSPGGSRIITTTLQIISNVIDHGMNIAEATQAPRFHHQWLPDKLTLEKGFSADSIRLLQQKGHHIDASRWAMGSTQSILRTEDGWTGASDPRQSGTLTAGY